jgi:hypothetical protein
MEEAKMKSTKKTATTKTRKNLIKLPDLNAAPRAAAGSPFTILNPGGGEIYKLYSRYHTKPQLGPCTFRVFWKDGPYAANNLTISLIDIKNWVVIATVANNIANVPAGQVGMLQWTMPINFLATDDCRSVPDLYSGWLSTYLDIWAGVCDRVDLGGRLRSRVSHILTNERSRTITIPPARRRA